MKSANESACGNPSCENPGKFTCSACSSISYCSATCQKSHWSSHKVQCKTISQAMKSNSSPSKTTIKASGQTLISSSGTPSDINEISTKLQNIKQELTTAYQTNDMKVIIKLGNEGISLAKLLPEPASTIELIQLHLNFSNAYMQANLVKEAEPHIIKCVEYAEKGLILRPNHPQAAEMLSVALVSKAYWLLNNEKLIEAEEIAVKARQLASQIYSLKEPRNFKTLRCMGIIREKQDRITEAEDLFNQAYELVIGVNPGHSEPHMVMDDLVQMLLKRDLLESAEKYARAHYEALVEKIPLNEPLSFVIGDAGARHASILCRMNRNAEAHVLMKQALELRVKYLGPMAPPVAMTLIALAGICEAMDKPREEIEALLGRAYEIFYKTEGPSGVHALTTAEHLRKLKLGQKVLIDEVSDSASSATSSQLSSSRVNDDDDDDPATVPTYAPKDGNGRMRQASVYFEKAKYNKAEVLLAQAADIFAEQVGVDNPVTKTARQNLGVVRHNIITKLWKEVVAEMTDEMNGDSSAKNEHGDGGEVNALADYDHDFSTANASGEKPWYVKEPVESSGCILS
jgi:tetratricopeptide (TPR) repeat protein